MQKTLSNQDRAQLDKLVLEAEKRTKTQIVLAVINRSDSYMELPWKAFALGASLAGLLIFILNLLIKSWMPLMTNLIVVAIILACGFVFALLSVALPGFARGFLLEHRSEEEVRQYAESLFLSRELFATSGRTGILMLVSLFERKVMILPDKGLKDLLTAESMQDIIGVMTSFLGKKKIYDAFEAGLSRLSNILEGAIQGTTKNELPNAIIEEKGV